MWALILIVGGGYAAAQISGFSSAAMCEAAYAQIDSKDHEYALAGGYRVNEVKRGTVTTHYCIEIK